MSITDSQKQEIENLKERLDRSFSVYQEKIYKLIYSFRGKGEKILEKELGENYKKFLNESEIVRELIFSLFKSINEKEDKNKLKELYDKINKQNGEN